MFCMGPSVLYGHNKSDVESVSRVRRKLLESRESIATPTMATTTTTTVRHPDGTAIQTTTTAPGKCTLEPLEIVPKSINGLEFFEFSVKGQAGKIPKIGLGTATLFDLECTNAVRTAIRAGYRHIDTALLYNNQAAVGEGIRQAIQAGEVTREELWVTSKIGFYPGSADGENLWVPIVWHACNCKGKATTLEAVEYCLQLLGLEYVDLMLIHNPAAELCEYRASGAPHFFDLFHNPNDSTQPDFTAAERAALLDGEHGPDPAFSLCVPPRL